MHGSQFTGIPEKQSIDPGIGLAAITSTGSVGSLDATSESNPTSRLPKWWPTLSKLWNIGCSPSRHSSEICSCYTPDGTASRSSPKWPYLCDLWFQHQEDGWTCLALLRRTWQAVAIFSRHVETTIDFFSESRRREEQSLVASTLEGRDDGTLKGTYLRCS